MKTFYKSHYEVCKAWAAQENSYGSGSRILFEGPVIYSYGHHFPMARFHCGVILFTTKTYSVSTAKHLLRAHSAARSTGLNVFSVQNVLAASAEDHMNNLQDYLERAEDLGKQAKRAKHWELRLEWAEKLLEEAKAYMIVFCVNGVGDLARADESRKQVKRDLELREATKTQIKIMREKKLTERDGRQAPCFVSPEKPLVTLPPIASFVNSLGPAQAPAFRKV